MRLLFIGCGNMGAAIAAGVQRKLAATKITMVDPNVERARELLPDSGAEFYGSLQDVADAAFDAMILAIKPQNFHALPKASLPSYPQD